MAETEIKVGTKVIAPARSPGPDGATRIFRVMAIAEGWAMIRYPRAVPFCVSVNSLEVWRG